MKSIPIYLIITFLLLVVPVSPIGILVGVGKTLYRSDDALASQPSFTSYPSVFSGTIMSVSVDHTSSKIYVFDDIGEIAQFTFNNPDRTIFSAQGEGEARDAFFDEATSTLYYVQNKEVGRINTSTGKFVCHVSLFFSKFKENTRLWWRMKERITCIL